MTRLFNATRIKPVFGKATRNSTRPPEGASHTDGRSDARRCERASPFVALPSPAAASDLPFDDIANRTTRADGWT